MDLNITIPYKEDSNYLIIKGEVIECDRETAIAYSKYVMFMHYGSAVIFLGDNIIDDDVISKEGDLVIINKTNLPDV